jgi:hypothetical protein
MDLLKGLSTWVVIKILIVLFGLPALHLWIGWYIGRKWEKLKTGFKIVVIILAYLIIIALLSLPLEGVLNRWIHG